MKTKDKYDKKKLIPDNKLTFYKYNYNLDLIDVPRRPYNVKIGFNKIIRVKPNLLILYGLNEMVILRGENLFEN